ncbi:MAG TPA: hypothetical protein VLH75_03170 [Longimicrobiales bacterium]|nr:hypothetical protein [Longimicrobiales bacterium]
MSGLLEGWRRYLSLLERQEACLTGPDLDLEGFQALALERAQVAGLIEEAGRRSGPLRGEDRARARALAQVCRERDQVVLERLSELRGATARALRNARERTAGRDGYLAGAHARAVTSPSLIDLRR